MPGLVFGCGGRMRAYDLQVMNLTSYRAAPPAITAIADQRSASSGSDAEPDRPSITSTAFDSTIPALSQACTDGALMSGTERVLVYSKYVGDLDAFRRVLAAQLPQVQCAFAGSLEEAKPYLEDAEILYGWGFPRDMLRAMPRLQWVQKMGAGVDDIVSAWPLDRPVVLTRTDGALIAARMAEYVVAAILDKSLRMDHARHLQQDGKWGDYTVGSIRDLTIGVAGLGEIGSEIARTLRVLGARVIGWRRSPTACQAVDKVYAGTA